MRHFIPKAALIVAVSAASLFAGRAMQRYHEATIAPSIPLSVIALQQCDALLGLVIITADGQQHPLPGATLDDAKALKLKFPALHGGLVTTPCGAPGAQKGTDT